MKKVLEFNHPTRLDIDPDKVLTKAIGKMEKVVIMGVDKEGFEYFASSVADSGNVLWYIERCKQHLLRDKYDD